VSRRVDGRRSVRAPLRPTRGVPAARHSRACLSDCLDEAVDRAFTSVRLRVMCRAIVEIAIVRERHLFPGKEEAVGEPEAVERHAVDGVRTLVAPRCHHDQTETFLFRTTRNYPLFRKAMRRFHVTCRCG
jgi:hypothetical protein